MSSNNFVKTQKNYMTEKDSNSSIDAWLTLNDSIQMNGGANSLTSSNIFISQLNATNINELVNMLTSDTNHSISKNKIQRGGYQKETNYSMTSNNNSFQNQKNLSETSDNNSFKKENSLNKISQKQNNLSETSESDTVKNNYSITSDNNSFKKENNMKDEQFSMTSDINTSQNNMKGGKFSMTSNINDKNMEGANYSVTSDNNSITTTEKLENKLRLLLKNQNLNIKAFKRNLLKSNEFKQNA